MQFITVSLTSVVQIADLKVHYEDYFRPGKLTLHQRPHPPPQTYFYHVIQPVRLDSLYLPVEGQSGGTASVEHFFCQLTASKILAICWKFSMHTNCRSG